MSFTEPTLTPGMNEVLAKSKRLLLLNMRVIIMWTILQITYVSKKMEPRWLLHADVFSGYSLFYVILILYLWQLIKEGNRYCNQRRTDSKRRKTEENKRLRNTILNKNGGYTRVLWIGADCLLLLRHPPCYTWKNNATEQGIPIGKHYFERLMVAIMTWLSVTKYLCHMWQLICSVYCGQIPPSLRLWLITRFFHMCNTFTNICYL
jgi:hypothetical protein